MKRERNLRETTSILGKYARKGIAELESKDPNLSKIEKALNLIQNLDKKEIEGIEDEKIKSKCVEVYKNAEKAEEHLNEENFSEVHNYLEKIIEVERSLYEDFGVEDLSREFSKGGLVGKGGNGEVYQVQNHSDKVLKIFRSENSEDVITRIKKYWNLENQLLDAFPETNIASIEKLGSYEGKPAAIIERAPGKEIHIWNEDYSRWSKMNEMLAKAGVQQYQSLFEDMNNIKRYFDIWIDLDSENLFYHPDAGFTIIDLGKDLNTNATSMNDGYNDLIQLFTHYKNVKRSFQKSGEYADRISLEDLRHLDEIKEKIIATEAEVRDSNVERFEKFVETAEKKIS